MAFPDQSPRSFTRRGIEALPPNQYGVYGLFKGNRWIYVGKGDLRVRLFDHLRGDNTCINSEQPTHFVTEVTAHVDARERELILELDPVCNQRVG